MRFGKYFAALLAAVSVLGFGTGSAQAQKAMRSQVPNTRAIPANHNNNLPVGLGFSNTPLTGGGLGGSAGGFASSGSLAPTSGGSNTPFAVSSPFAAGNFNNSLGSGGLGGPGLPNALATPGLGGPFASPFRNPLAPTGFNNTFGSPLGNPFLGSPGLGSPFFASPGFNPFFVNPGFPIP